MADWSRDEVEATVSDYFAMLRSELAGRSYSKTAHNERLRRELSGRSRGSVEFKHQNISAVLVNCGLPFIRGYKPRQNYQQLLEAVVLEYLAGEPAFFEALLPGPLLSPVAAGNNAMTALNGLVEAPPEGIIAGRVESDWWPRVSNVDFVRRDAENRRLGQLGEEWALEFEAKRLVDQAQRPDLAKKIEWSSHVRGDGLGYDIQSFNADGTARLIEVKTTGLGKEFPFLVTSNEVRVSVREHGAFQLYRLFEFATKPRVYMLPGALTTTCSLEPTQYRARVR